MKFRLFSCSFHSCGETDCFPIFLFSWNVFLFTWIFFMYFFPVHNFGEIGPWGMAIEIPKKATWSRHWTTI